MSGFSPKVLLAGLFLFAVCLFIAGYAGWQRASDKYRLDMAGINEQHMQRITELTQEAREKESQLQKELAALAEQKEKEKKDAQTVIKKRDAAIADLHLRLSVPTTGESCRAADSTDTAAEPRETRAELEPTFAQAVLAVTDEGDDAIRDLNRCIDQYEALRNTVNQ